MLAELAPAGGDRVHDVTRGGQPLLWLKDAERAPRNADSDRLAAVDALHREERVLRRGWGFIAGQTEIEGTRRKVRLPLLTQPVRLERTLTGYRLVPAGDAEITPLVEDRQLAAAMEAAPGLATPGWLDALGTKAWLWSAAEATGLTVDAVTTSTAKLPRDRLVLVAAAALFVARDVFGGGLVDGLRSWAGRDLTGTALAHVYDPPGAAAADLTPVLSPLPLTRAQAEVVATARTAPITVVSGPPGSGKSHTVIAAALEVVHRGGSVLVATQSPHAADVLAGLLARYPAPTPVLFGNAERRAALATELAAGAAAGPTEAELRADRQAVSQHHDLVRERTDRRTAALTDHQLAAELPFWQPHLAALATDVPGAFDDDLDFDEVTRLLHRAASSRWSRWRLRRKLRIPRTLPLHQDDFSAPPPPAAGQLVSVSSWGDWLMGDSPPASGRFPLAADRPSMLEDHAAAAGSAGRSAVPLAGAPAPGPMAGGLTRDSESPSVVPGAAAVPGGQSSAGTELSGGVAVAGGASAGPGGSSAGPVGDTGGSEARGGPFGGAEHQPGGLSFADELAAAGAGDRVRAALRAARTRRAAARLAAAGGATDATSQWAALHQAEAALAQAVGTAMRRAVRSRKRWDTDARRGAAALATALRAGRNRRRELLSRMDAEPLVRALPLWIGTVGDVEDLLPATPGMFDLVVLDEASHVDQIRAAPVLARARRALVVGDPRQLRFVSFVSDVDVAEVLDRHGADDRLDVRRVSAYDLAAGAAPATWLDEHHRSAPHLIGFPARRFYDDRVTVATRHPRTEATDAIDIVRVPSPADEVGAVVDVVRQVAASGRTGIGVVSPFRPQADALEQALLAAFPAERIEQLGLRVGTVHAFQGSEADTVVASLGLADGDPAGRRRFVTDPHLFNVMITRARRRLVVVTALTSPDGLLGDFFGWADKPPEPALAADPPGWAGALTSELRKMRVTVRPGYAVGSWTVDLCAGPPDNALGIFCAVHPDGPAAHIARHRALRRAGWHLADILPADWHHDARRAALEIAAHLAQPAPPLP
ncbi:hypothetical protein L083_5888 [Actinoplanes sp. N902-109]|nr:hypothetical protein L083_5888 [Actinoplanes sp. N902-109]